MKHFLLLKERSFWIGWVVQAVIVYTLALYVLGTILQITFRNAGRHEPYTTVAILILFFLLPAWVLQLITTHFLQQTQLWKRWLVILGTYVYGLGPAIIYSAVLLDRWKMKSHWRWPLLILLTMIWVLIFYILMQLYVFTVISNVVQVLIH